MTFLALLTKEMRLRLRHERTIWVIIAYIFCTGLIGWISLTHNSNYTTFDGSGLDQVGLNLYSLLIQLQLFLLIFITPTFTATAINGEKEHQTFDLLVCSRLSTLSLIGGKLVAGFASTLFLIIAAIPLFSMIFFFGGVSFTQILGASLVCLMTVLFVGAMSFFCSAIFQRTSISTAITYTILLTWLLLPCIITHVLITPDKMLLLLHNSNGTQILLTWNPFVALNSTYPSMGTNQLFAFLRYDANLGYNANNAIPFFHWNIAPWLLYSGINLIITPLLFLLCLPLIRNRHAQRSRWCSITVR